MAGTTSIYSCRYCEGGFVALVAQRNVGKALFCSRACKGKFYAPQPAPMESNFWRHVDKRGPDECWPWTGGRNAKGYGCFSIRGKRSVATRASLEIATGKPVPDGMLACHTCDNPPCVNPAHLFVGTPRDNMQDQVAKGRSRYHPICRKCGHERTDDKVETTANGRVFRRCAECRKRQGAEANRRAKAARADWMQSDEPHVSTIDQRAGLCSWVAGAGA